MVSVVKKLFIGAGGRRGGRGEVRGRGSSISVLGYLGECRWVPFVQEQVV